ncbi:MAG: succinate dehydrogenase iron-sulfur subunit [Myxococcota bacterium]
MSDAIIIRIQRQDGPQSPSRMETFSVPFTPGMTVMSCLLHIQANPVTSDGKTTTPVAFQASCLQDTCGSCAVNVNGWPTQACSVRVDELEEPVVLAPLHKFPVVRDLVVDRSRVREQMQHVKPWVSVDGLEDLGPGPRQSAELALEREILSRCTGCGACLEACPNYGKQTSFVGAAPVHEVRVANLHPTGEMQAVRRLEAMMEPGGVSDCGNAQNCVRVCPVGLPLTTSIASVNKQVNRKAWRDLLGS